MPVFRDNFGTPQPNAEIELYNGALSITINGQASEFDGRIWLSWLPSPRICFSAERPSEPGDIRLWADWDEPREYRLNIPGTVESAAFFAGKSTISSQGPVRFQGKLAGPLTIGPAAPIVRVQGSVANFGEYWFPPGGESWRWEAGEWAVTISPVARHRKLIEATENIGGYAITHDVAFERNDGGSFAATDAEQLLHGLFRFLSFMQGRKVNIVLPVGFDSAGAVVWRQWLSWQVTPMQGVNSWADTQETEHLGEAFAGFMRLWANPEWRDAIDAAIHWYVDSNRNASVLEAGTIFNQMALERLAWEYFVIQKKTMTPRSFEKLKAPHRIRRVLAEHGVPHGLPAMPNLQRWAREFRWKNIADAVAAMRNIVIHPDHRHRGKLESADDSPLLDIWHCGLWALELLLLRLFGYNGGYQDRRKKPRFAGQPDPLPWTNAESRA